MLMICGDIDKCTRKYKKPFYCCDIPHILNEGCTLGMEGHCPNCIPYKYQCSFVGRCPSYPPIRPICDKCEYFKELTQL